jgi:predicted metalloprotease
MRLTAVSAAAAIVLTGCATLTTGTPVTGVLPSAPNAQLPVVGDSGGAFDTTTKNALSDVIEFWKRAYPSVSNGKQLPALRGGLYSVDGAAVMRAKTVDGPAGKEACVKHDPTFIVDNAAYCGLDDAIVWDRAGKHLVAVLAAKYGNLLVALVFAHEFGHAIQAPSRLDVDPANNLKTIYAESQADCAAGAFIGAALKGQAPHFRPTARDVDQTLAGFLLFRDSTPESQSDTSHGNGFDRLAAFDDGIQHGVSYCYSDTYFSTRTFTERQYVTNADYTAGGNETLAQVLNPGDPKTDPTAGGLQPDLNRFWTAAAKSVNKTFTPVQVAEAAHPECGAASGSEFGYCPADNTVYYSNNFARAAYYSLTDKSLDRQTAEVTVLENQPADFALGTLFAMGWGLAVRHQLFAGSTDDKTALLAAACYTGAYAKDVNRADGDATHSFILSPPDMDEATSAMLSLINDRSYGARSTTGLERVRSFVKGYSGGLSGC